MIKPDEFRGMTTYEMTQLAHRLVKRLGEIDLRMARSLVTSLDYEVEDREQTAPVALSEARTGAETHVVASESNSPRRAA